MPAPGCRRLLLAPEREYRLGFESITVWITTEDRGNQCADIIHLRSVSRSHAPAWECIPGFESITVWVTTEDRGNQCTDIRFFICVSLCVSVVKSLALLG